MLTFSLNKAPPTPAEIAKEWARFKWRAQLTLILIALVVLAAFADAIPGLESYKDFNYNLAVSVVLLLPMIALAFQMLVILYSTTQWKDLDPISKADCLNIEKGLDQPLIANYCTQVGDQGRELVAGEYDAIVQQIQLKKDEIIEAQLNAVCKKVYGLNSPPTPMPQN